MRTSDSHKEENYMEYLRLLQNSDYKEVTFDSESGGVSAVHKFHKFDSEIGAYGVKIGDYEKTVVTTLRRQGHSIILESEIAPNGVKTPDGRFDGLVMDIKSTEGTGKWALKDKFHNAVKQGAECVILYFPSKELYSQDRVHAGWHKFLNDKSSQQYPMCIKRVVCIVEHEVAEVYEANVKSHLSAAP